MTITAEQERELQYYHVEMVRKCMTNLPSFSLPPGYRLRYYRPGEGRIWADIETSVAEFDSVEKALAHFEKEFGPHRDQMAERCLFLESPDGAVIGTTTAWYNADYHGQEYGRIHWVGIRPKCQGCGLAKPLLAAAMQRLAQSHDRAYLTTQTTSARAIRLYLDFGFVPHLVSDECREGWRLLASVLGHPALSAPDSDFSGTDDAPESGAAAQRCH